MHHTWSHTPDHTWQVPHPVMEPFGKDWVPLFLDYVRAVKPLPLTAPAAGQAAAGNPEGGSVLPLWSIGEEDSR